MEKVIVFHPSLAPYRIDFFNSLNDNFNSKFIFFYKNLNKQKFDQENLKAEANFHVHYLKKSINLFKKKIWLDAWNILKKNSPDIVFTPEYDPINLTVLLYKRLFFKKVKIYSICDDSIQVAKNANLFKKLVRGFFLHFLDGVILTNDNVKVWYKNNLNPKARLLIFPIIRNEKKYHNILKKSIPIAKKYEDNYELRGKKVLLFVGRLAPEKNILNLIRSFKKAIQKDKELLLVIVGSGDEEKYIYKLIQELGLTDVVKMVGRYEGEELYAWYLIAHIFILPSTYEPFGAVVNEALLAGCYALVSEMAGASSLIKEGVNGYVFNPAKNEEIADTIISSFNKFNIDKKFGAELGGKMIMSYQQLMDKLIYNLKA